jgi:hypothetical protein
MKLNTIVAGVFILSVAACVTVNKSILSNTRMMRPVTKDQVQVFFSSDTIPAHERIAILNGKGDEMLTNESQLIDKLREEAGKLGANAIILNEVKDPGTGAKVAKALIGTAANRKGAAIAIYVPSLDKRQ